MQGNTGHQNDAEDTTGAAKATAFTCTLPENL